MKNRISIAGLGRMGLRHYQAIRAIPNLDWIGFYDPFLAAAPVPLTRYATFEAMCDRSDMVVIATPSETHSYLASIAISLGCSVLTEKPLSLTRDSLESLARVKGIDRCWVAQSERFHPLIEPLEQWIHETSGPIEIDARRFVARPVTRATQNTGTPPLPSAAPNPLLELGVHDVDLLFTLFGERPNLVDLRHGDAMASLRFSLSLAACRVTCGYTESLSERTWLLRRKGESCLVDWVSRTMTVKRGNSVRSVTGDPEAQPLAVQGAEFVRHVRDGRAASRLASFREAARVIEFLTAPTLSDEKPVKKLLALQ